MKYELVKDADKLFLKQNFEVSKFCDSRFSCAQTNMLARIHRSLVNSINSNKQGFLPKYYLFVLYDDLITYLDYCHEDGLATLLGTWVEWLANEPKKLIKTRRDEVPDKSKKLPTPFLYWVVAPTHSFFSKERKSQCIKFNLCLESVIRTKDDMHVIKLRVLEY